MFWRRLSIAFAVSFAWIPIANSAEVVFECGASEGWSYFFEDPRFPETDVGWQTDQISTGQILLLKEGTEYEIAFGDAIGAQTVGAQGGEVLPLAGSGDLSNYIALLVIYPGPYFEHYLFRRDLSGEGEVVWGSMKWPTSGVGVALQRLMRAPCD